MRLACLVALLLISAPAIAGPVVGAAVAAGVGGGVAAVAAGGAFLGAFVVNFGITLVLGAIAQSLSKKSADGTAIGRTSQTVTTRQAAAPRDIVVGRVRKGGVITYLEVTGNREYLHMVITFTGHEIEEFDEIWLDNEVLTLDGSGEAQGDFFATNRTVSTHEADVPGSAAYEITTPQTPVEVGGVFIKPILRQEFLLYGINPPPIIKLTDVSPSAPASATEYSRSGSTFTFHSSNANETMQINYTYTTGGASLVRAKTRTGAASDTVFSELVAESSGKWTANHLQAGCAKIYVRIRKSAWVNTAGSNFFFVGGRRFLNPFEGGVPNITAVIKGAKAYDPRSATTVWTRNPALLLAWYLTQSTSAGGVGIDYATQISESHLIAAANVCDESVALAAGGTESRYTCDGAFSMDSQPAQVIEALLSSMAGSLIRVGTQWQIHAGAYITPTETLDESECRGNMRIQSRISRRDLFNAVRGTYVAEDNNWQVSDFPAVSNATYATEDGETIYRDVDLPFTTSAPTAQRLAKIALERVRQQITVFYPGQLSVFRVQPPETVLLTNTRMGWSGKAFEVVRGQFSIYDDAAGNPALGYDLELRETASEVWDWSAEETAVDPAPDTNLPSPFDVPVPAAPSVAEEIYATSGSAGVRALVRVSTSVSDPTAVSAYLFEYKASNQDSYVVLPLTQNPEVVVEDLAVPGYYDFRVRCLGNLGLPGDYGETTSQQLYGLTAAPSDVTGFSVQVINGEARVSLDRHQDLDVLIGGRIMLRWSPLTSGAAWNDGALISPNGWPGDTEQITVPLPGTGTVMAKARDSTGHYSANAVSFVVTEALLTGFTTQFTLTEHSAFSGTKTDVVVTGSALELDTDAAGVLASGSYDFNTDGDLGSVLTARLFPHIKSSAYDTAALWDSRTSLIDTWADIDSTDSAIDGAEVRLMVRVTDDDPAGTPTWGAWHALPGPSDYTARGFDFRLDFTSDNVAYNRAVTELQVVAKTPT